MMKTTAIILCFLWVGIFNLQAQTKADATSAIGKQEYRKAIDILTSFLAQNPKDGEGYYLLGTAYFENEDLTNAQSTFNRGITAQPKYGLNFAGLGRVLQQSDNTEEAKKNFQKALDLTQSNNVEVLTQVADGYLAMDTKESLADAEKLLIKAKTLDSKNVFVYTSLGDLYLKRKIDELALNNYRKAIELDKTFLRGYLRVGQLYIKDKKYNEGAQALREALQVDPEFAPAYRELGELYYRAGKYEDAKNNYKKYVELTGNDLIARARYAGFLYLTDDFEASLAEINTVMKDTSTLVLLRIKGYCLLKIGNYAESKSVLDAYFKVIKPKDIIADDYEIYAKTLEKLGDDSTAIEYYYKAIEKDATKATLLNDIAQNYTRQKKYDQSVGVYKKIVETNPSFKNYYDLGKAYYSLKDYENARVMFDQMKVSEPEVYLGYFWAGNALAQTEDMENPEGKAKADYEKTIELISASGKTDRYKNDFIASNSYLAYLYYSKEDFENAYKHCEAVLSIEAEHPQCKPLMEFLAKNKKP